MTPKQIKLNRDRTRLTLIYPEVPPIHLAAAYLRAFSPSAEARNHARPAEDLPLYRDVLITGLEAVGRYALKIRFSDGHDTGLYRWDYLCELAQNDPTRKNKTKIGPL